MAWMSLMEASAVIFLLQFLVIKALDKGWIRIAFQPKMLVPNPYQINTEPKHYWKFMFFSFYIKKRYEYIILHRPQ